MQYSRLYFWKFYCYWDVAKSCRKRRQKATYTLKNSTNEIEIKITIIFPMSILVSRPKPFKFVTGELDDLQWCTLLSNKCDSTERLYRLILNEPVVPAFANCFYLCWNWCRLLFLFETTWKRMHWYVIDKQYYLGYQKRSIMISHVLSGKMKGRGCANERSQQE